MAEQRTMTESGTVGTKQSKITLYIGTATADKEFESRALKVYITDFIPYVSGNLEATEVKASVGTEDDRSDGGEGKATLTNSITAQYFSGFTNRYYPPDIRRGEQVFLFNIGDADTYYWFSLGMNDNLRRCETFRIAISDDVAYQKELHNDNTWFFELRTLPTADNKRIKEVVLSTSKSDGEEFRYLIKIDAVNNTLQFNDDVDNMFLMESKEKRMFMRNTDGSYFELNKKNATVCAVEDVILKAGRQIVRDTPVEYDQLDKGDKAAKQVAKDIHLEAEESIVLTAPMVGIKGPDGKIVNVTCCGDILTKGMYFENSGIGTVSGCSSEGTEIKSSSSESDTNSGSSPQVRSLLASAANLFTEAGSTGDEEPIEENRPEDLKDEFAGGYDATIIRQDTHYHNSLTSGYAAKSYQGVEIDINTGRSSDTGNVQNDVDTEAGRHTSAWDQVSPALDRISEAIRHIRGAVDNICEFLDEPNTEPLLIEAKRLAKIADKLGVEARVLGVNSFMPSNHGS